MAAEYSVVGKPHPDIEGLSKTTGAAKFVADLQMSGVLHAKILRSPHAHARIRSIDITDAERHPGVKAILTHLDVPKIIYGAGPPPFYVQDEYILGEKVRYVGDKVAAVAAVTPEAAEEALELIHVDYEVLPAVFDSEDAMQPNASPIHETDRNLTIPPVLVQRGDVEKGFKEADFIFEDKYSTQRVQHCTMETHAYIVLWDAGGRLTVWTSAGGPYRTREVMARALGLRLSDIRVIVGPIGGNFGSKGYVADEPICALLSKRSGRPVKLVLTRAEELGATVHRHSTKYYLKTGVKKDGTLVARYARAVFNKGAYANIGPVVINYTSLTFMVMYRSPHAKFEGYLVYTNTPMAGAYRGFGDPQTFFAVESQLDAIARELKIDPVDLRVKNHVQVGDMIPDGMTVGSCGLSEAILQGAKNISWWDRRNIPSSGISTKKRGMGMALGIHFTGVRPGPEMSSALVKMNEDGTVNLLTSVTDVGTGAKTVAAQMVAEELGVRLEDVKVAMADTDVTPYDEKGAIASRMTYVGGAAARAAAVDAKRQIFQRASKMLDARVEDLTARDRKIFVKNDPSRSVSLVEALAFAQLKDENKSIILGRGSHEPQGKAPYFAAQFAEVEVDTETGQVAILRYVAAQDVGFAINPLTCEGQVEGALHHGLGLAMTENMQINEEGYVANPSFEKYRLMTTLDMPSKISVTLIDSLEPTGPYGAKGAGEGSLVPTAAVIANAVYDAIGVRIKDLPVTPEKIWRALQGGKRI